MASGDGTGPGQRSTAVAVVGTGVIGGSLAFALQRGGARIRGWDADPATLARAVERGAVHAGESLDDVFAGAEIAFVAVPVSRVADVVEAALKAGVPVVSDVGSVKAPLVRAIEERLGSLAAGFVGGHPMTGPGSRAVSDSEVVDGIEGAGADLFDGATWVLTPTERTDSAAFATVRTVAASTGAEVVALDPELHDSLVATVSHLPHVMASCLMHLSAGAGPNQDTLLRLAAGGFRAMTRVSGRDSAIWPDICVENRAALVETLDRYVTVLDRARALIEAGERPALLEFFERARAEGHRLPDRASEAGPLVELVIPVPDRPGVLAEVTTLAGHQGVNIADLEISHGTSGGVLVMTVPAGGAESIAAGLEELGYRVTRRAL